MSLLVVGQKTVIIMHVVIFLNATGCNEEDVAQYCTATITTTRTAPAKNNIIHFLVVTGFSGRKRIISNNSQHHYHPRHALLSSSSAAAVAALPAPTHNKLQVLLPPIYLADDYMMIMMIQH